MSMVAKILYFSHVNNEIFLLIMFSDIAVSKYAGFTVEDAKDSCTAWLKQANTRIGREKGAEEPK